MTVNLTRIYTRLGDGGETHLGDMSRVPKTDPRIQAYGTVDELNAQLGVALTIEDLDEPYVEWLRRIQNDLFDVGADIAAPPDPTQLDHSGGAQIAEPGRRDPDDPGTARTGEPGGRAGRKPAGKRERLRVIPAQTRWLEERCDQVNAGLQPLKSFVLPGGTRAAAHLHVCRTVCRRAERLAVACGDQVSPEVVRYLNRLSDLLFILSRAASRGREPLWEPGRYR